LVNDGPEARIHRWRAELTFEKFSGRRVSALRWMSKTPDRARSGHSTADEEGLSEDRSIPSPAVEIRMLDENCSAYAGIHQRKLPSESRESLQWKISRVCEIIADASLRP
jgi:hypothetical protein